MLSKTDPTLSIVVTNLDHDGNVTPWTLMAEEKGIAVRRSTIICFKEKNLNKTICSEMMASQRLFLFFLNWIISFQS